MIQTKRKEADLPPSYCDGLEWNEETERRIMPCPVPSLSPMPKSVKRLLAAILLVVTGWAVYFVGYWAGAWSY